MRSIPREEGRGWDTRGIGMMRSAGLEQGKHALHKVMGACSLSGEVFQLISSYQGDGPG